MSFRILVLQKERTILQYIFSSWRMNPVVSQHIENALRKAWQSGICGSIALYSSPKSVNIGKLGLGLGWTSTIRSCLTWGSFFRLSKHSCFYLQHVENTTLSTGWKGAVCLIQMLRTVSPPHPLPMGHHAHDLDLKNPGRVWEKDVLK